MSFKGLSLCRATSDIKLVQIRASYRWVIRVVTQSTKTLLLFGLRPPLHLSRLQFRVQYWRFGLVVTRLSRSPRLIYAGPGLHVLGWVTVSGVQLVRENLSQYIHAGQLSLAIPPWVGAMSTSQTAVMLCGWGVKAGMVRECMGGR